MRRQTKENSSRVLFKKPHGLLSDITITPCLCSRGLSISHERKENIGTEGEEAMTMAGLKKARAGLNEDLSPLQPRHGPRNPRHNGHKPMKARIVFSLLSNRQYAAFLYSCFIFYPVSIGSKPTTPSISVMLGGCWFA